MLGSIPRTRGPRRGRSLTSKARRGRTPFILALLVTLAAVGCGDDDEVGGAAQVDNPVTGRTLKISAIPDQDPAKLTTINSAMARHLATTLGIEVEYVPVSDYAAAVSLFKTGDVDMVFFGGLTGTQARLQVPGAVLLAQRDIDESFRSVFIASSGAGLGPVTAVAGLRAFEGKRFTFGSETSTSGRLMPEFFLDQAGVTSGEDFAGPPGYSGSHDKTIDLVQSGSYEGGALNLQVWNTRTANGSVDLTKVVEVYVTPPYHDYHWMAGPDTDNRFGTGFTDRLKAALLGLRYDNPEHAQVLDLYGAKGVVETKPQNYAEIEQIGRKLGLIR